MKKLTAAIAALALYFSASAFGPVPENSVNTLFNSSSAKEIKAEKAGRMVLNSFKEHFATASNVTWKENQGLYFGYFIEQNREVMAAFSRDGELVAIGKSKSLTELPALVSEKLKTQFADCYIGDQITELQMNDETAYYLSVENKTSKKILKFYADGQVETIKKTKKKVLVGSVS